MHVAYDMPSYDYGPPPERSFSVPGLKSFLIGYWREEADYSLVEAYDLPADAAPDEIENFFAARPVWIEIPQILCALYPGDGDVLELVWEQEKKLEPGREQGVSVTRVPVTTLELLNIGRFATPEANAFRVGALVAPGSVFADAVVSIAAEGLALSRPVEAVPHLVSAELEHPGASGDVLVALAGYGDDVLGDHASGIASMLDKLHVKHPPMGAVADAVSRLGAFGRRQRDAEPR